MHFLEHCLYYFCMYGGPFAQKTGQILSIRDDIVSAEFRKKIKHLQDSVMFTPEDNQVAQTYIQNSPYDLRNVSSKPLKSGTISLVYKAFYRQQPVVVKVIRPGMRKSMVFCFNLMMRVVYFLSYFEKIRKKNIYHKLLEIKASFLNQCNFKNEVKSQTLWYNTYNTGFVRVPKIFFSTDNLICMQYVPNQRFAIRPQDREKYAYALLYAITHSLHVLGLLHSDLHPGNVLFDGTRFYIIDFGWTTPIQFKHKKYSYQLGMFICQKDYKKLARYAIQKAYKPIQNRVMREKCIALFERELRRLNFCEDPSMLTFIKVDKILSEKYEVEQAETYMKIDMAMLNLEKLMYHFFRSKKLYTNIRVNVNKDLTIQYRLLEKYRYKTSNVASLVYCND